MAKETKKSGAYGAEQISVLEGLDPVRKRPGMYIGSTGPEGLHHLIWEVVDNSFDEAMAGHANEVTVTLNADGTVSVTDNGRGIPVDIHKQYKVSALELVLTKLHAGGKFGGEESGYKISGGLHGVGVSVVNALSDWLEARVERDGEEWVQEYERGKPKFKAKKVGASKKHGTTITFKPDATIFTALDFDLKFILDHLRQQCYLSKGIKVMVTDARVKSQPQVYGFFFEGGVASYVKHLNHAKQVKQDNIFYVERETEGVGVEVGMQYSDDFKETVFAFANNIYNPEGGSHVMGFRSALTRVLNNYARSKGYLKEKDDNLTGEDVREGMTAVISVKIREPQFEGQTKAKLGNPEVRGAVETVMGEALATFLEESPRDGEAIMSKCILAQRARAAARAARDTVIRRGALEGLTLPGKLADCASKDPSNSELFIVEGDSAGGSAKQGRDRDTQAILPLRGKILNVERARLDKMIANNEIKNLIIAMGTGIGESMDVTKLRYDKIIIMTDADVDGAHIRTLLLTLFYRYFNQLITEGHIYIAQPPLYRVEQGKKVKYAFDEKERDKYVDEFLKQKEERKVKSEKGRVKSEEPEAEVTAGEPSEEEETSVTTVGGVKIARYKGLGEMNPEQLWETTMDPTQRIMKKVTIVDAAEADETFDILMGAEVAPRKRFIQTHAKNAKIDV
ncbi:MAG: DNA topoisomerase (ATP-hydrolyzing) subunit B [Patescibacteria group bacterium]|jgi:DNA gyrase subunit B